MHTDVTTARGPQAVRRVSWGAIFAGAVVSMALMVFFTVLGIALGASSIDPLQNDGVGGLGAGAAIYLIVTQILSLVAGGYVASRFAGVPRFTASVLHGASVWALSTVLLAWAAVAGAGAVFNTASSVLTSTVQGASNVVQTVVPEDISFPDVPELAGQISVEDLPDPIQATLEENNISVDDLQREARQALSQVISEQERQEAIDIMQSTLSDVLSTPGDIGEEMNQALDRLVGGPDALLSDEDRQDAVAVLERRLGITSEEATQVMQAVETRIQEAFTQVRQTIDQIQQEAVEAVDAAADTVSATAWWLTFASLLGLAAAMGGAILGKPDGMLGDRIDDRFA